MKNCFQACSIIRMCYFKRAAGFQLRQEHSSHHLAADDDEFSELGSPLVSGLQSPVKLMTEKNDRIKKNGSRWNSSGSCSTVEAIAGTEYVQLDPKGTFSYSLDDVVDEPNAINTRTAFVTVANIPPSIELSKLMDLSRFGKISNSSMQTLQDGSICCDVKFERIDENTLNVFFGVESKSNAKNILKRLNCTIMDDCNWSASLQSSDAAASASSSDDGDIDGVSCNSGLKIGEQISELKRLYTMKKLHVEDLENLLEVIMHIKFRNDDLKEQL